MSRDFTSAARAAEGEHRSALRHGKAAPRHLTDTPESTWVPRKSECEDRPRAQPQGFTKVPSSPAGTEPEGRGSPA